MVREATARCRDRQVEEDPVTLRCPNGHDNEPNSRYCGTCGARIDVPPAPPAAAADDSTAPTAVVSMAPPPDGTGASPVAPDPPTTPSSGPPPMPVPPPSAAAAPPPAAPQVAGEQPKGGPGPGPAVALIGAGAAIGSTFLPWLGWGPTGLNGYDIPFAYLWSQNPQPSDFTIGLGVAISAGVVMAVAGLMAAGGLPPAAAGAVSLAGGIYAMITFAFGFQTIRSGLDFGIPFADIITDVFGLGIWVALGAAVMIGIGARLRPR